MNQIKKKLHSNAGASVILALALTLICIMVASVIIAAAASGAGRNATEKGRQQTYLAVTSAAQYIADNLNSANDFKFCGVNLSGVKPCNKYKSYETSDSEMIAYSAGGNRWAYAIPTPYASLPEGNLADRHVLQFYLDIAPSSGDRKSFPFCASTDPAVGRKIMKQVPEGQGELEGKVVGDVLYVPEGSATGFSGIFKEIMEKAAESVYRNNIAYSTAFTVRVPSDDRIPDVQCTFNMDLNYKVTVDIAGDPTVSEYAVTVELPATGHVVNPAGWNSTEECEHNYFYDYYEESTGNVKVTAPTATTFTYEVDNETITVTWGTPVIRKKGS